MRLRKEVRLAIDDYIADKPKVTREEIANLIKKLEVAPDVSVLMEREYNNAATRFLASKKDKRGHRTILSNPETKEFVNIEISNSIGDLNAIKEKLKTNVNGYNYTINKIDMKTLALTGQITIAEYLTYSGEIASFKA